MAERKTLDVVHGCALARRRHSLGLRDSLCDSRPSDLADEVGVEQAGRLGLIWLLLAIAFGGRAEHTGIEVELHPFHLFQMRDAKAVRWKVFAETEREQALEAVGLAQ
jgi:hypothetical protein